MSSQALMWPGGGFRYRIHARDLIGATSDIVARTSRADKHLRQGALHVLARAHLASVRDVRDSGNQRAKSSGRLQRRILAGAARQAADRRVANFCAHSCMTSQACSDEQLQVSFDANAALIATLTRA